MAIRPGCCLKMVVDEDRRWLAYSMQVEEVSFGVFFGRSRDLDAHRPRSSHQRPGSVCKGNTDV